MMNLRKPVGKALLMLVRVTLTAFGFSFTCLGAFLLSVRGAGGHGCRPYVSIAFGFLLLIAGVVWTTCESVKSKAFGQRQQRRQRRADSHICTIDRPDFYPPSYEESLDRNTDTAGPNHAEPRCNIAPPLYTVSIIEVPSEDYSLEDPPSYMESVLQRQSYPDTPHASPAPTDRH